jgi:hypothetical protein
MTVYVWPHMVDGVAIGEIRRFVQPGGKKVDIPYYIREGNDFASGIPEEKKPLPPFGLPSITNPDELVIVVEGQKVQAALASLGLQVVTSILGAKAARSTDWRRLMTLEKMVFFWPDNDKYGREYCRSVCALIAEAPAEKFVCEIPGMPEKGDGCDWLKMQPELKDWNELDPLNEHPARDILRRRLLHALSECKRPVPDEWLVDWPEPEPIESRLMPVDSLNADMLPPSLRTWIEDTAMRLEVPLEYPAIGAIVAAGSAIGTRCGIRPRAKDDWTVIPNVWGVVIGPPGDGKSPALREAISSLETLEHEAAGKAASSQREYDAKLAAYTAREKAIKDEMAQVAKAKSQNDMASLEDKLSGLQPPDRPNAQRYIANDTTVEALIILLKDNPRGLLMFQDELVSLLESWEKQGHETDRSFFLQCWTGNGKHRQDRVGRGSIVAEKLCLSVLGGIQEDMLRNYLTTFAASKNDGLIQRFQLMVYPNARPLSMEDIDVAADREARLRAFATFRDLARMDFEAYGAQTDGDSCYFRFDAEAQALYREWLLDLKQKMASEEDPMMREHLSKFRSLMPSLSLIFHLIECTSHTRHGDVRVESANLAAAWCGFLEDHARRVYGLLKAKEEMSASVLAERIQAGLLPKTFNLRQLLRKNWRSLNRKEVANPALEVLLDSGWLRKSITQTGGHPRIEYHLNPKISPVHKVSNVSPVS